MPIKDEKARKAYMKNYYHNPDNHPKLLKNMHTYYKDTKRSLYNYWKKKYIKLIGNAYNEDLFSTLSLDDLRNVVRRLEGNGKTNG